MGAKSKNCLKNIESRNLIPTEWFLYIFSREKIAVGEDWSRDRRLGTYFTET